MKSLNSVLKILCGAIGPISITLFPIIFLYSQNILELDPGALLPLTGKFLLLVFGVCMCFLVLTRNMIRTIFISNIFLLLIMNFKRFEQIANLIFPTVRYWHVLTAIVATVFIVLIKIKNEEILDPVNKVITIVFCGLILVNIVPNLPKIMQQYERQDIDMVNYNEVEHGNLPNIYYLVFDEYSSNDFMQKYYNYDNSGFTDYLEKLGFNVSYSSFNETYMTQASMTNMLNLDFLYDLGAFSDEDKIAEMKEKQKDNLVFSILQENGYQIQGIGNPEIYGLPRIEKGMSAEKSTIGGETLEQLIIGETIFYPFYVYNSSNKFQSIQTSIKYLLDMDKQTSAPAFTLFHVEITHTPFVVDGYGNPIPGGHSLDWKDKKYYKGTYIYCTEVMKKLVSNILNEDPDSIIVLCSDHSARAGNSGYESMFEDLDRCKIFNALYFRGELVDIEGLSGINTMRKIFNHLFGSEYKMLETHPLISKREYEENE